MKKIILKRAKIEQWVEHLNFDKLVVGTYVKFSYKGQYRLAEIAEVKDNPDGGEYELGKVKTSIKLGLKMSKSILF